ncbi:hypothetical protein [Roseivirga seohaensis]|uniref:hypothetical protein n=1 Tax=Roseivirga seohaensis TaxID=1914963 RepID=UPI003BA9CDE1
MNQNNVILTYAPNGQEVYLTEDFLSKLDPKFFEGSGLGVLPAVAAAPAAGKVALDIGMAALQVIPNLLTNNFWKEAGPAVADLNAQAQNQLAQSNQFVNYATQLVAASDNQNAAIATAINNGTLASKNSNTVMLVGSGILAVGVIAALLVGRKKKKKSTSKK